MYEITGGSLRVLCRPSTRSASSRYGEILTVMVWFPEPVIWMGWYATMFGRAISRSVPSAEGVIMLELFASIQKLSSVYTSLSGALGTNCVTAIRIAPHSLPGSIITGGFQFREIWTVQFQSVLSPTSTGEVKSVV